MVAKPTKVKGHNVHLLHFLDFSPQLDARQVYEFNYQHRL